MTQLDAVIDYSIDALKEINKIIFTCDDFMRKYYVIIPNRMNYGEFINMISNGYTIEQVEQKIQQWVNRSYTNPYKPVRGILP